MIYEYFVLEEFLLTILYYNSKLFHSYGLLLILHLGQKPELYYDISLLQCLLSSLFVIVLNIWIMKSNRVCKSVWKISSWKWRFLAIWSKRTKLILFSFLSDNQCLEIILKIWQIYDDLSHIIVLGNYLKEMTKLRQLFNSQNLCVFLFWRIYTCRNLNMDI